MDKPRITFTQINKQAFFWNIKGEAYSLINNEMVFIGTIAGSEAYYEMEHSNVFYKHKGLFKTYNDN